MKNRSKVILIAAGVVNYLVIKKVISFEKGYQKLEDYEVNSDRTDNIIDVHFEDVD